MQGGTCPMNECSPGDKSVIIGPLPAVLAAADVHVAAQQYAAAMHGTLAM